MGVNCQGPCGPRSGHLSSNIYWVIPVANGFCDTQATHKKFTRIYRDNGKLAPLRGGKLLPLYSSWLVGFFYQNDLAKSLELGGEQIVHSPC